MTTIAYRDGFIVGDTCIIKAVYEGINWHKVGRLPDGRLWGLAGCHPGWPVFLRWIEAGAPLDDLPKFPGDDDSNEAILVDPEGKCIWIGGAADGYCPVAAEYFAIGMGHRVAFGALDYGATALDAVKIAAGREYGTKTPLVMWGHDWKRPQIWIDGKRGLVRKDELWPGPAFEPQEPQERQTIEDLARYKGGVTWGL